MRRTTFSPITRKHFLETVMVLISAELADSLCGVIDAIFISRGLGSDAIAAHGVASPVFTFLCIFAYMAAAGIQHSCTASVGKRKLQQANGLYNLAILFTTGLAVLFTLSGWFFPHWVARLLGAAGSGHILPMAADYIRGTAPGTIPLMLFLVMVPALQLDGKWALVHVGSAVMAVSDILFDCLNIYYLHWGMFGMGLATSVSYILGIGVFLLYFFQRRRLFRLRPKDMKDIPVEEFGAAALPTGVRISARMLSIVLINVLVLRVGGAVGMAAMAVHRNLFYLFMGAVLGVAGAVLVFTSISYGEQDRDGLREAMRLGMRYTLALVGTLALGLFLLAGPVVSLYLEQTDPSFGLAVFAIRCLAVSLPFMSWNWNCGCFLQGVEQTRRATALFVSTELLVLCLCCLVGSFLAGIRGVFAAFAVSQALVAVLYTILSTRRWRSAQRFFGKPFGVPASHRFSRTLSTPDQVLPLSASIEAFCRECGVAGEKSRKAGLYAETMCGLIFDYGFRDGKKHSLEVRLAVSGGDVILRFRDDCHRFNLIELVSGAQESAAHPENAMAVRLVTEDARKISYNNSLNSNNLMVVI